MCLLLHFCCALPGPELAAGVALAFSGCSNLLTKLEDQTRHSTANIVLLGQGLSFCHSCATLLNKFVGLEGKNAPSDPHIDGLRLPLPPCLPLRTCAPVPASLRQTTPLCTQSSKEDKGPCRIASGSFWFWNSFECCATNSYRARWH